MVVTLRYYDNCFLLVSTLLSLIKCVKNSLDIKVTFCRISWKSENRKDNFEGSPRTFGTDFVYYYHWKFNIIFCTLNTWLLCSILLGIYVLLILSLSYLYLHVSCVSLFSDPRNLSNSFTNVVKSKMLSVKISLEFFFYYLVLGRFLTKSRVGGNKNKSPVNKS